MSRPWMPLYWGDYYADTRHLTLLQHGAYLLLIGHCWQHERLPDGDEARATILGISVREWRKIKAPVEAFFLADGTHKRIRREAEKTEQKIMQRAIAGRKGGTVSGINRTLRAMGRRQANEANRKQTANEIQANGNQNPTTPCLDETKQPATIHKVSNINLSAEREEPPLVAEGSKRPDQMTRAELESTFSKRQSG